jgi:hypothetical protein
MCVCLQIDVTRSQHILTKCHPSAKVVEVGVPRPSDHHVPFLPFLAFSTLFPRIIVQFCYFWAISSVSTGMPRHKSYLGTLEFAEVRLRLT